MSISIECVYLVNMINHLKSEYKIPQEDEIRLDAVSDDISAILKCIKYHGFEDFKKTIKIIPTQQEDIIFQLEILDYYENNSLPKEPYMQIFFNIELLYIKFYMLDEMIKKHKKIPFLKINNLKLFRQAFAHSQTGIIFHKPLPSIQYIKWFKKDMSKICYTFLDWDNKSTDIIMDVSNDIKVFGTWWKEIFEVI